MHPNVHEALVTTAKTRKQTKRPLKDEWIKKMRRVYLYTHTHIYIHWNITQP